MPNGSLYASAQALPTLVKVGCVGLINLGTLTLISFWRTVVLIRNATPKDFQNTSFRKKLLLHALLLLATAVDIPMYVSFVVVDEYSVVTYAFHKLECAFIFTAYSITITDWSAVLYEINEDSHVPFLLKRGIVWTITIAVIVIALLNFIYCLAMDDLETYTETPIYIISIVGQMFASLLLTCVMLHGGIKLAWRIKGASRHTGHHPSTDGLPSLSYLLSTTGRYLWYAISCCGGFAATNQSEHGTLLSSQSEPWDSNAHTRTQSSSAPVDTQQREQHLSIPDRSSSTGGRSQEFLSALRCLNIVMATCASCEFIQMTLLFLNWVLGYAGSQSQTVGPVYFYWTFYAWVPLWGVILALLYLASARNSSSLRKKNQRDDREGDLDRPLMADGERDTNASGGAGALGTATAFAIKIGSESGQGPSEPSSPSSSYNSSNYSYTYRGQSTSVSHLASDVFFRDIHAASQQAAHVTSPNTSLQ